MTDQPIVGGPDAVASIRQRVAATALEGAYTVWQDHCQDCERCEPDAATVNAGAIRCTAGTLLWQRYRELRIS